MQEIERMFDYLSDLGLTTTITPGYSMTRQARHDQTAQFAAEDFFLTRAMTVQKIPKIEDWMNTTVFSNTGLFRISWLANET